MEDSQKIAIDTLDSIKFYPTPTKDELKNLLASRVERESKLLSFHPVYKQLSDQRKAIILEIHLLNVEDFSWKQFWNLIEKKDYANASLLIAHTKYPKKVLMLNMAYRMKYNTATAPNI